MPQAITRRQCAEAVTLRSRSFRQKLPRRQPPPQSRATPPKDAAAQSLAAGGAPLRYHYGAQMRALRGGPRRGSDSRAPLLSHVAA